MARRTSRATSRPSEFFATYTRDVTAEDLQRLFTHDARDAYRFFSRGIDRQALDRLPWHRRLPAHLRLLFLGFTLKLSPARRVIYGIALLAAALGLLELFTGFGWLRLPAGIVVVPVVVPRWEDGTILLLTGFVLMNLLVLLEVADRLSLKNDLEIAREIQLAMLPHATYRAPGLETHGETKPANTVGGDFYEILPLDDGRVVVAVGDVAGKGSPAALLMALLLAMLRTLLDEGLEPPELIDRLNWQIVRHAPRSRFVTLYLAVYTPSTGRLVYVNAGHLPPLVRRAAGSFGTLEGAGPALGLSDATRYVAREATLEQGDLLVLYSDGITEAEDPDGRPFDEAGLEQTIESRRDATAPDLCQAVLAAVASHVRDKRFADDLTVLALRRLPPIPVTAG